MPLYEYVCRQCQRRFEVLVRSGGTRPACPHCGSRKFQRQFSTFSAHGSPANPCSGGTCPASGSPADGCGGGNCPFA